MRDSKVVMNDVLVEDKDCYDELWNHMEDLVYSIAYSYFKRKKSNLDDVKQNAYLAWYDLTKSFSVSKMMGDSLEANYVSYLNKYLPKRLYDYADEYSLFNDYRIMSLDPYTDHAFLSDKLVLDNEDLKSDRVTVEVIVEDFTDMRKKVFNLMKQGHNKTDISRILEVNRSTVYHHYYKIMDTLEEKLKQCNKK